MDFFNIPYCVSMLTYYVNMDTKEGLIRKFIRQHGHKRRHVKEIHISAWTQKKACQGNSYVSIHAFFCVHADVWISLTCLLLCPCWRMDFFNMPSFVFMLTYGFLYHAFICVDADVWISLACLLLCRCWRMNFLEMHTSTSTQKKACKGNSNVSMDTKEGMLRKCIRQHDTQ
jgi:hypothetical protein